MRLLILCFSVLMLFACSQKGADEHLASAKTHLEKGELSAAEIALKNVIQEAPKLAEARYLLGKVYLEQHQYENAEKEFERALEYNFSTNKVLPLLSQAYQKTGADNALIELSLEKLGLTPANFVEVQFYKLQALVNVEQIEKANVLIEEIQSIEVESPFKSLALTLSFLLKEQPDVAIEHLQGILAQYPNQPDAMKLYGNLLLRKGDINAAIDIYRQYVNLNPEDLTTSFFFARLLIDANLAEEAEPIVDKLLAINEQNSMLNQFKGIARFGAKDYENALKHSELSLQNDAENSGARLVAGISAYFLEDYEKSHQHLSFVADQLPENHQGLRILAASQLKLGLSLEASNTLDQIDEIGTQDTALFSSVGLALLQTGETQKAKKIVKNIKSENQNVQGLAQTGILKLSLNDVSGIINLEEALVANQTEEESDNNDEQKNQNASIEQVLATAYLTTGKLGKAFKLAEKWQTSFPQEIKGFMLEGMAHLKSEQLSEAKAAFEKAVQLSPENPSIKMSLFRLAIVKAKADENYDAANQQLSKILESHPQFIPAIISAFAMENRSLRTAGIVEHLQAERAKNPENPALTLVDAKMSFSQKDYQQTLTTLSEFLAHLGDAVPLPQDYWQLKGESLFKLKMLDQAKTHFQAWIESSPNNRMAVMGNITLLEQQREYEQALVLAEKFSKAQGNDPQLLMLQAHLSLLTGQVDQAREFYRQFPEQLLAHPLGKGILGQLQLNDGQLALAQSNLTALYDFQPSPRNTRLLYFCMMRMQQTETAYQFLEAHIQSHPNDISSMMSLAEMQIPKSYDLAIATYNKALAVHEDNGIAQNNIAFLYLQQKKLDLARQHAEKAFALDKTNSDVLDTLGQILLLQNEPKKALEYLSAAVNGVNATKITDDVYINYVKALIVNEQYLLARDKIEAKTLPTKIVDELLALLPPESDND